MNTGILITQLPWQHLSQVLEHVLSEEWSERSHHPCHGVDHREESLKRL